MSKKGIQWLYQELPELIRKGILSQQNADNLRQYYGSIEGKGGRWLALIIFGIFGALLIGLGIILLIGHNWEDLSRQMRTILSILPLLAGQLLVGWTIFQGKRSIALREGSATFLTFMIGASIALVGQTYHIPGNTAGFLLTWMLLTIPLVYLLGVTIPAIIYMIGITSWACYTQNDALHSIFFWPLAMLVVPHFVQIFKKDEYAIRFTMFAWVISLCLCVTGGITLGKVWPGSWVVIYTSLFAILYLVGNFWFAETQAIWKRPFHVVGAIGIFITSFILTYKWPWKDMGWYYYRYGKGTFGFTAIADCFITLMLLVVAIALLVSCVRRKLISKITFGIVPVIAVLGYSISRAGANAIFPTILFNIYLLAAGIITMITGLKEKSLGIVNVGMLMLTILIVARFFDSSQGFVTRGLAFIILGTGFLVTNIMLIRHKGGAK
ncbi:MAG: DUF2157 domain-containing protein [Candidatus Omnitrophota bacterium]|nr:MAG: DUF2157 domain-containing protein [Candidatus Omnitrophota bacterium]